MASRAQQYFNKIRKEINGYRKNLRYFGEGDRSEVENYWLYLYVNELNSYAEDEELPNWEKIWKPRLLSLITSYVDEYVEKFNIHTNVDREEPDDYVSEGSDDSEGIPFEALGDYELLSQIGVLRGTIYLTLEDLLEDIEAFKSYVLSIRKLKQGYQIWVEKS
jgi:hypothetical protein